MSRAAPAWALAVLVAVLVPWWAGNPYWVHVATLICTYWVLVCGLNLVVGYSGQLSIGHVGLLAVGAYTFGILAGRYDVEPFVALAGAGLAGGISGLLLGLPSLRLPEFYFAMATMAFALIMGEVILELDWLTGGGIGLAVPGFKAPFATQTGFYLLCLGFAVAITLASVGLARSMWGRGLIAVRDSTVAASATGVPIFRVKLAIFVFSGVTAGVAGGLFAVLQSYITPDTFTLDLGLFFFTAIIVGGRGSIAGPLIGTVILTVLPETVGSLAHLGTFFYGILLLLVVLLIPEGVARALGRLAALRPGRTAVPAGHHTISPDLPRLTGVLRQP